MKKLGALILLAVLAAGGFAVWRRAGKALDNGARYEPADFRRERLTVSIESTGIVKPRNRLEIKPPIGGRMDEVLALEGQTVRKGDIIARMSSTERATLLDAARARGEAVLRKWEDAYKATSVVAPLDGTIIARNTEPGQTVTAQDAIFVLSDTLVVMARVDETDIGQVRVGQAAVVKLDAYPNIRVPGVVNRIAYEALTVNNVTVYEVEVEPAHIPECMKSGMTAAVAFVVAMADDALTLPATAIASEDGRSVVLLADGAAGAPPRRWRVLTGLSSGGRTEVLAGLKGDEPVVTPVFSVPRRKQGGTSPLMPSRRR